MSPEVWKPTDHWPGYEVSSLGRVRRSSPGPNTHVGKVVIPKIEANGYLRVGLCRDGQQVLVSVHRLVCEAFHGPAPTPAAHAAHWNGVKTDNRADNLRWASPTENQADKRRHGTLARGEKINHAKLTPEDIRSIRQMSGRGISQYVIADLFRVSQTNISSIIRGKTWRHVA